MVGTKKTGGLVLLCGKVVRAQRYRDENCVKMGALIDSYPIGFVRRDARAGRAPHGLRGRRVDGSAIFLLKLA